MNYDQKTVKIKAAANKQRGGFDVYVMCGSQNWDYLMYHRRNEQIYALLRKETDLRQLQAQSQKAAADIARSGRRRPGRGSHDRKGRRNRSKRMEGSVRHLIGVVEDYLWYEDIPA